MSEVRVAFFTEQWVNGGVAAYLMSILRYEIYHQTGTRFDLIVAENSTQFYDEELSSMGVRKITLLAHSANPIKRVFSASKAFDQVCAKEAYDIIYFNVCNAVSLKYASCAKNNGCPRVIVHSHNSSAGYGASGQVKAVCNSIARKRYKSCIDMRIACSDLAANWLFGKGAAAHIIPNGIDLKRFSFSQSERNKIRDQLEIGPGEILVGHIGRFIPQKNHRRILRIFEEYKHLNGNSKLLLIGNGPDYDSCMAAVANHHLEDSVISIKETGSVPSYLSAMDVFFLPSLFEGLPIVGIEAQATGLPCLFSDSITKQIEITGHAARIPLEASDCEWAHKIDEALHLVGKRTKDQSGLEGYSSQAAAKKIDQLIFRD